MLPESTADIGLRGKLGQFNTRLRLPTWLAVFGDHVGKDTTAHVEFGSEAHEFGIGRRYQVIENLVGYGFMEAPFIPERPDIKFEALQLDAFLVWDVVQVQHGEIRLAGFGAQAGEFGDFHMDMEITARVGVVEGFQIFAGLTRHKGYRINRVDQKSVIIAKTSPNCASLTSNSPVLNHLSTPPLCTFTASAWA